MSKERAQRREVREREAAVVAAARAGAAERRDRQRARRQALGRLRPGHRSRPPGLLAARRRRQRGITAALLLGLNVLVWVLFPDWPTRAMALIISLLAVPVLHTMLFRRT
ncbi:MAG: hypothetical protein ABIN79_08995 [Marmoricola sp.]